MIPKTIHYCWFGGKDLPNLASRCIESWKRLLPDYEIKCWSEENFDIENSVPYLKEAYFTKKFAFVSDYVRLYALYNEGGIYMDTDVEVINDFSKLLGENTVLGYEDDKNLTTAFIAVPPKAIWVKELLDLYEKRSFIKEDGLLDLTTNVIFISNYLKEKGLILNGKYIKKDDIEIYPSEYFSPRSWDKGKYHITDNTYTIHYFAGTWHSLYTRFLTKFMPNTWVAKIAGIKEFMLKITRKIFS